MDIKLDAHYTLFLAIVVLLIGRYLLTKFGFLKKYNIPIPVAGGLSVAMLLSLAHSFLDFSITTHSELQNSLMLMFFISIGLGADLFKLKEGGKGLFAFLAVIAGFIFVQNIVGVSLATLLGIDPLIGLIAGSITLSGGHGTAGAWGDVLEQKYMIEGAMALGMAAATFGLVAGGVVGGPLANLLIKKHNLKQDNKSMATLKQEQKTPITSSSVLMVIGLIATSFVSADILASLTKGSFLELPLFVWALASGVVLRNLLFRFSKAKDLDGVLEISLDISLSLYLAMALLSLKLWQLSDLAAPLAVILLSQVVVMLLYAYFVTFRAMRKNYDASMFCAGHCGFGLGATPTAMANMQSIANTHGYSYRAFLIVPLCGAFFIDIVNATTIQLFLSLFSS